VHGRDIGLVFKKLREDAGLSQRKLAEQLGLPSLGGKLAAST
jgi:transcriptional regulator with XRE-family HTH domain